MGTIHRTTISIPQELKDEMDAVKDQVNWSAVAARAFRSELARIATTRRRTMTKEDVVKRLKAEQEKEGAESKARGKRAGRMWAERHAGPGELRRLMKLFNASETSFGSMEELHTALHPGDPDDLDTFKEEAVGFQEWDEVNDDLDFVEGFVDGATDVWDEVENEL
jgi:hypothetical protein